MDRRTLLGLVAACVAGLIPLTSAHAQTSIEWVAQTGDFMDGANWDGGVVPGTDEYADINNGGTALWDSDGEYTVWELRAGWNGPGSAEISGGGIFNNMAWTWIGGGGDGDGTVTVSGEGTVFRSTGETNVGRGGATGVLNLEAGTLYDQDVDAVFNVGRDDGGFGTLNLNGGSMILNGETWIGQGGGSNGTLNFSSGEIESRRWFVVGRGGGTGAMTMTGGVQNHTPAFDNYIVGDNATGTMDMSGGTLNIASELWVGQGGDGNGVFNFSGGEISVNRWLAIGRDGGLGEMNMTGGTYNHTSGDSFIMGAGNNSVGTLTQSGGTVNSDGPVWVGEVGTGTYNLSGDAELNANAGVSVGHFSGTGEMNLDGGTLNTSHLRGYDGGTSTVNFNGTIVGATGDNDNFIGGLTNANIQDGGMHINTNGFSVGTSQTFSGSTGLETVEVSGGGSLAINGELNGIFGVNVATGTTLRGTGSIDGLVSIADGATLAPGNSIGTLSVANADIGGTFQVEYDGAMIDRLDVAGSLDITEATVEFVGLGDDLSGIVVFATYGLLIGTEFNQVIGLPDGYSIDYNYEGANSLALVPEPSTYALLFGIGMLTVVVLRRRRR
jgi:hypothetical protein